MGFLRNIAYGTVGGISAAIAYDVYRQDENAYRRVLMPLVARVLEPEDAHKWAVWAAKNQLFPKSNHKVAESLKTKVLGIDFESPVGMAAGFDKNGECVEGLAKMGFGFVEIGSVTPKPQPGNEKPRVFRLPQDLGVINRYGFNSDGHDVVHSNLEKYLNEEKSIPCVLGINLGKNKTSPSAEDDYSKGVKLFYEQADYLVVNISSPNTPGLRSLQGKKQLENLVKAVKQARDEAASKSQRESVVPLLVKIAPDLTEQDKLDISSVVLKQKLDGLIVSNTTISRPETLKSVHAKEGGGLSGYPVRDLSTKAVFDMYKLTKGKVPIIGVGGVANGRDALDKIKAGASLVQFYSAITYQGPPLVKKIQRELAVLLEEEGYENVSSAVGAFHE